MAGQRSNDRKRSHSRSDYSENRGSKRRNPGDEREQEAPGREDTVYRYLCPLKKIGSIMGKGGEIVKKLRAETQAKISIGETVPGSEERVVTIISSSRETNTYEETGDPICPAQDALFRIFDRLITDEESADEIPEFVQQPKVRLLVPSDQIGCILGKGGQVIQGIRSDTGAEIRIVKADLPACALSSDELLQVTGETSIAKKALYLISCKLHDFPSRSQHLLTAKVSNMHQPVNPYMLPDTGAPIMGLAPLMGPYGGYSSDAPYYSRDSSSAKEFSLRLVCPTDNIGGVIGKSGSVIKQIRQDSGAQIKVDSSAAGEDCIISISSKEYFDDPKSATIDAAVRLQPRCSEKNEKDSSDSLYTTRLLVPKSQIGCLLGKGGSIISEMRKISRAMIRILSKENLPEVANKDDEMVQISGDLEVAQDALVQVTTKLKANLFERDGALSSYPPAVPYYPMPMDVSDDSRYGIRDSGTHGRGYSSYSGGYGGSSDVPLGDDYGGYGGSQSGGGYGAYDNYSSRSGRSGYSGSSPISHGRHRGH